MTSNRVRDLGTERGFGRSKYDWLFFAALAVVAVWFFREVLVYGNVFFFRDFGLFFYPKRFLIAQAARRFEIPYWENLTGGGGPVLGSYQGAVFYPISLVYYVLPMPWSFDLFIALHFIIAGAGTYYMLRAWETRRIAAAIGALAWAFTPSFVSIIDNVSFLTSLAWLPLCMGLAMRLLDGGGRRYFLGVAVAFAMCILAGAPEPVIFTAAFVGALTVWQLAAALLFGGARRTAARATAVIGGLAVGVLLSGVELGPFLTFLKYSDRGQGLSFKMAKLWPMTPVGVLNWFLPRFYLQPSRGGVFFPDQGWLKSLYVGAAVAMLAIWAVAAVRRRRELFFAAVLVTAVALAFGQWSPLWRLFYAWMPGFSLIRFPVKFFLPAAFAFAVLAAFAVDEMIARCESGRARSVYAFAIVLAGAGVLLLIFYKALSTWPDYFMTHVMPPKVSGEGQVKTDLATLQYYASQWSVKRSALVLLTSAIAVWAIAAIRARTAAAALLGVILVTDIALFSDTLSPVTTSKIYTEKPYHLFAVEKGPGAPRMFPTPQFVIWRDAYRLNAFSGIEGFMGYLAQVKGSEYTSGDALVRWAREAGGVPVSNFDELVRYLDSRQDSMLGEMAQFELNKETFYPNLHLLYGVPVAQQGDALFARWISTLLTRLQKPTAENSVKMETLFAASVVVDLTSEMPHFKYSAVAQPRPRAMLTYDIDSTSDEEQALAEVTSDGFDPARKTVLVLTGTGCVKGRVLDGRDGFGGEGAAERHGTVRWIEDSGNSQTLETSSQWPALLYEADTYYPLFRATVDGKPVPIFRANCAFRAVPVPAGTHRVTIKYFPLDLYMGLAATGLGIIIAAAAVVIGRKGRPAANP